MASPVRQILLNSYSRLKKNFFDSSPADTAGGTFPFCHPQSMEYHLFFLRLPNRGILMLGFLIFLAVALPFNQDPNQLRDTFRRVNPSVVVVHALKKPRPGSNGESADISLGSGVIVTADGKILTAAHVIQAADLVEVEFLSGRRAPARILASAPVADIALLQIQNIPDEAVVARLADSDLNQVGDQIFAIGAPYGATHSLSVGYVSARRSPDNIFENLTALQVFQLDLAIFQGNSGGPVFNLDGQVIGIVTHVLAAKEGSSGPAFAVTSNVARKLMLEERRIWLGVEARLISGPAAAVFNLNQGAGLLVQSVAADSLGARLGLHEGSIEATISGEPILLGGDIILEMMGRTISPIPSSFAEIQAMLNRLRPGEKVSMKVLRSGEVVELETTVREN